MNKRTKAFLKLISVCVLAISSFLPTIPTFATECGGVDTGIIDCDSSGGGAIREILSDVVNIVTIGVGVLGVIGISVTGIQYLTAGGNEEKTRKAKVRINEIIIGLGIYATLWIGIRWLIPGGVSLGKIDAENISFVNVQNELTVGDSTTMNVAMYPLDAGDTVVYSSSNSKVATIDSSGKVVARSPGATVIKAESSSGKTATVNLVVSQVASSIGPGNNSQNTNTDQGNTPSDITKGLTQAQAQKLANYYNSNEVDICRISQYCNKNDCSAFVAWFLVNYTDIQPGSAEGSPNFYVNGNRYGNNLIGVPMQSDNPGAYSVVSTTGGGFFRNSNNHVELIVATEGDKSMTVAAATGGWVNRSDGPAVVWNEVLPSGLAYNNISNHIDYNKLRKIVGD